jgi:hypothetical protein
MPPHSRKASAVRQGGLGKIVHGGGSVAANLPMIWMKLYEAAALCVLCLVSSAVVLVVWIAMAGLGLASPGHTAIDRQAQRP